MDSTVLRLILLALGILALGGIYLWETRRRKQEMIQAKPKPRQSPRIGEMDEIDETQAGHTWGEPEEEPDNLDAELQRLSREITDSGVAHDDGLALHSDPVADRGEQQEMFGLSALEESPVDVPGKIIQLNIKAKAEAFSGEAIQQAVKEVGLEPGEMQIYHRLTKDGRRKPLFNMASMVEPGVFPLRKMQEFSTPGLTLFAQLPGPGDSMGIFSDMLFTAERLATILGGVLQDDTHSTLTKQTIETLRSEILEHRRLVQLARSRR